ncbi:MAG TPA: FAD-binding oxidoreductase [Tepidisphaeraceae bacterium]|jgi:FAD/FMN-containing dehydrogenase|nr:FAD-binding oxidoreductase [Tepidisphaeraceae bacterium]
MVLKTIPSTLEVNDVHSQLNRTRVRGIARPGSVGELQGVVQAAAAEGCAVSIAGGRHAMGGQQFAGDGQLIDTRGMNRVLDFDRRSGVMEVQAGIQWPQLVNELVAEQADQLVQWGIRQKQTGADRLSLGGALAANVHGRGLKMRPIVGDVEAFTLIDADGEAHRCSRTENRELFSLAIGGYGLFGVVCSVALRLAPRQKLERVVREISVDELKMAMDNRIREGFIYGDFQFAIDDQSDEFLHRGVFSCYRPVGINTPMPKEPRELKAADWCDLIHLAHVDKTRAYRKYAQYYLGTSGQIYWSDLHQMSTYLDDYHGELDHRLGGPKASEVITELYVPRARLAEFMMELRNVLRERRADLIYGTVRLIEKDDESFLAWAREDYACIVLNLHVVHQSRELRRAGETFRALIGLAADFGGSFYLTYHRHGTAEQVERCYPQFGEFLKLKLKYDPDERFTSEWYRHYRGLFA